jgi:hypothetical protein
VRASFICRFCHSWFLTPGECTRHQKREHADRLRNPKKFRDGTVEVKEASK